jgi:hypothetical protein
VGGFRRDQESHRSGADLCAPRTSTTTANLQCGKLRDTIGQESALYHSVGVPQPTYPVDCMIAHCDFLAMMP